MTPTTSLCLERVAAELSASTACQCGFERRERFVDRPLVLHERGVSGNGEGLVQSGLGRIVPAARDLEPSEADANLGLELDVAHVVGQNPISTFEQRGHGR